MKQHLEIEYKTMISQESFLNLLKEIPFAEPKIQKNVYYDTPDHTLYSKKVMCRIRTIDSNHEFTLKIPQEDGVMEHEIMLPSENIYSPLLSSLFQTLSVDQSKLIETAVSITTRYEHSDEFGVWCLDKTDFKNHTDYELEYELHNYNQNAYSHYKAVLSSLNINLIPSKPKYIRALNSLG